MKNIKKGFTLIELIIVMAIFGIIMLGVMKIADPLAKVMNNSSNKERSAAYVDNISDYMDKSLRYAKYLEIYEGELSDYGFADNDEVIADFVDAYFDGCISRKDPDQLMKGKIHIIRMINQNQITDEFGVTTNVLIDGNTCENGQIWEWVYDFTCSDSYTETVGEEKKKHIITPCECTPEASSPKMVVNPEHLSNYSFFYDYGYSQFETMKQDDVEDAGITVESSKDVFYRLKHLDDIIVDKDRFALSVVAYLPENLTVSGDTHIFKAPSYMSTVSMYLINADRIVGGGAPDMRLLYDDKGTPIPDPLDPNAKSVKAIDEHVRSKPEFIKYPVSDTDIISSNNLTFVYVVPSELYLD